MRRILSFAVALATAAAFSPTLEAKGDKDGHGGGGNKGGHSAAPKSSGGGGGGGRAASPSRPQMKSGGGNIARVQPYRGSQQLQRYKAPQGVRSQAQRKSPSVALTGRSAAQERGANWNDRRRKLIAQQYRAERREDRRDAWEDRWDDHYDHHDGDHYDHHDWDDHDYYYAPYSAYRYWNHGNIYTWGDHRYHWYNNAWVVINPGLGYGYDDGYYYGSSGYNGGGGGSLVADVQRELSRRGYRPGPVDGVLGGQTRDAIAAYQRNEGLGVTGRIDSSLLRDLGL